MSDPSAPAPGVAARRLAIEALVRIDEGGAYANLVLAPLLDASDLDVRDRALVTELVYGTTRRRRSCAWLVDRFLTSEPPAAARAALWIGAYQLAFLRVPAHAALNTTVAAAPKRYRALCNAVLRKVQASQPERVQWPDDGTRLSYPDWILDRLRTDLGCTDADAALEQMNEAPEATERADGYIQDLGSQWVADAVGAGPGERVVDVCAAPGGKATGMAGDGAFVVANDVRSGRVDLVVANARRLGLTAGSSAAGSGSVVATRSDGRRLPLADRCADRVLVDAPCSGLGTLRRRADARWRIQPDDITTLVALQRDLLHEAVRVLRPGGVLVYSVCTLTAAETLGVDEWLREAHPSLRVLEVLGAPWRPWGRGALLLPQAGGTDGMFVLRMTAPQ